MKPGDIVLLELRQADGNRKRRPALLLKQMPRYNDWLLCGISTQTNQFIREFDLMIEKDHPDFSASGLLAPSVVRLGFLAVIPDRTIPGVIGTIDEKHVLVLLKRLAHYLINSI